MARQSQLKSLLVEGPEDRYVFGSFCNALFGERKIEVVAKGGVKSLLDSTSLQGYLQDQDIRCLALIVDGDSSPLERWTSVKNSLAQLKYSKLPEQLPKDGLVLDEVRQGGCLIHPRFGLWVMPDNQGPGCCETFLWQSIESDHEDFPDKEALQQHLRELSPQLRKFDDARFGKALLRTWLTWSKDPDLKSGDAVRRHFLPRKTTLIRRFCAWLEQCFPDT